MKTMSNPEEFYQIHKDRINQKEGIMAIRSNFKMREFISSFGFWADKELADKMLSLRDES